MMPIPNKIDSSFATAPGVTTQSLTTVQGTDASASQANQLAADEAMIARVNADLKARYISAYNDYVTNMRSGQMVPPDRRQPPAIPHALELTPPNSLGMVYYQTSTTQLVVDPQDYPAVNMNAANVALARDANHIAVGPAIVGGGGRWFGVGSLDGTPSGFVTPPGTVSGDGVSGIFQKYGAPVGAGWYLKID